MEANILVVVGFSSQPNLLFPVSFLFSQVCLVVFFRVAAQLQFTLTNFFLIQLYFYMLVQPHRPNCQQVPQALADRITFNLDFLISGTFNRLASY